jgi:hypothetical protein
MAEPQIDAEAAAYGIKRPARGGRRSSRYYNRYHRCKRQNSLLRIILFLTILALTGGGVFSYLYVSKAAPRLRMPQTERKGYETRIAELESTVQKLNQDITSLSEGRIPGLHELKMDKVININKEYVKNVVFSVSHTGNSDSYDFKLLLHNGGTDIIQPKGSLALFDRTGLQLGVIQFKKADGTMFLAPGETRSYYDRIDLSRHGDPAYYMLELN